MNIEDQNLSQEEKIQLAEALYKIYAKIHECDRLSDEEQSVIFTLSKVKCLNSIHKDMLKRICYVLRTRLNRQLKTVENNSRTAKVFSSNQSCVRSSI